MTTTKKDNYIEAVGRRKQAVARVRISKSAKNGASVNGKELEVYFPTAHLQGIVLSPLALASGDTFSISAKVLGGGIAGQAEAVRHGLSRALVLHNQELRGGIKKVGFLTRDSRSKERRKFGLKKARKRAQWSKR